MIKKILFLSFIALALAGRISAQVSADFMTLTTEICGASLVNFTNLSNGTGTITYSWDFGDGSPVSTQQNPAHTYNTPGTYTVTLVATNQTNSDTEIKEEYIHVYPEPVVGFEPASLLHGCVPLTISMTDTSLSPGSAIQSWEWDFGDGSVPSNQQNPEHTYITTGIFDVSLKITDTNGCVDFLENAQYVNVTPAPVAIFVPSTYAGCEAPLTVDFSNASTPLGSIVSNEWVFGDGDSATVAEPNHTFDTLGIYPVQLVVTDNEGCMDTLVTNIEITNVSADFAVGINDTVCVGDTAFFVNNSVGDTDALWQFGTGQSSTLLDPTYVYNTPGEYQVTLIASAGATCKDTIVKTVIIEESNAAFIPNPAQGCKIPTTVTFSDQSTNAAEWYWEFGDDSTSTEQNPVHDYFNVGTSRCTLYVTSVHGCQDRYIYPIVIELPEADFNLVGADKGCGRELSFTDVSDANETIVSWQWDFGDGEGTDTVQNPTYNFTYNDYIHGNKGECEVQLIITTETGCTDTVTSTVYVGIPPVPMFYIFSDEAETPYYDSIFHGCPWACFDSLSEEDPCPYGCGHLDRYKGCAWPDTLMFYDSSYVVWNNVIYTRIDSLVNSWQWDFGLPAGSSTEQDPKYSYLDADTVGFMDIELIAAYHNCYDTLVTDSLVEILGPIINKLDQNHECETPYTYTIYYDLVSGTEFHWMIYEYDGGVAGDTLVADSVTYFSIDTTFSDSIVYTFPDNIDYYVVMWAYNDSTCCDSMNYLYYSYDPFYVDTMPILHKDSCMYFDSVLIRVRDIKAIIQMDTMYCAYDSVFFSSDLSQDDSYTYWNFPDPGILDAAKDTIIRKFPHRDNIHSVFPFTLTVRDMHGCTDDTTLNLHIYQPFADYYMDSVDRCYPFPVFFSDTSSYELPIQTYQWFFGDGGFGYTDTITHLYSNDLGQNNIQPMLRITDTLGCTDIVTHYVYISRPVSSFSVSDLELCVYENMNITNTSHGTFLSSEVDYTWIIDSNDTLQVFDTAWFFADTGYHSVSLIIDEYLGCLDTSSVLDIYVQRANAAFVSDTLHGDCYPLPVTFTSLDSTGYISDWDWDFGDLTSHADLPNSVYHQYTFPGEFSVILSVETTFGCTDTDTLSQPIVIEGPWAQFTHDLNSACKGDSITFEITDSSSVTNFIWDFGDGSSGIDSPVKHPYYNTGNFNVVLWIYKDECQGYSTSTVYIKEVSADFSVADSAGCEAHTATFVDNSLGSPTVIDWNFGDNNTASGASVTHTYPEAGVYQVLLSIEDPVIGCDDTISKRIYVWETPEIDVMKDTIVCLGESLSLWGIPADSVKWTPEGTLNNSHINTPLATPDDNMVYTYTIWDQHKCTKDTTLNIYVHTDYNLTYSDDTVIFIGASAGLFATADQEGITYQWSPDYMISCVDCQNPIVNPVQSTQYTLYTYDTLNCNPKTVYIIVTVDEKYRVAVPTAFTPNGDGHNDIIKVEGIGIKEFKFFEIYNRWGELVFRTDDMNEGWDGTYFSKPQNMDTYVYKVQVLFFNGEEKQLTGNISLLR